MTSHSLGLGCCEKLNFIQDLGRKLIEFFFGIIISLLFGICNYFKRVKSINLI